MIGETPYGELASDEVVRLYKAKDFPTCIGTPCDKFIQQCWQGEITSAQEAYDYITALVITWVETSIYINFFLTDFCRQPSNPDKLTSTF